MNHILIAFQDSAYICEFHGKGSISYSPDSDPLILIYKCYPC